jgi:hypothetical protein
VLEPGQRCILGLAASQEGPEVVQRREPEIPRSGADTGAAVVRHELDIPAVAIVVEVEQDAGHGGRTVSSSDRRLAVKAKKLEERRVVHHDTDHLRLRPREYYGVGCYKRRPLSGDVQ